MTIDQAQAAAEETVVTVSRRTLEEGLVGADLARNFAEWVGVLQREIESGEGVQDGTLMLVGGACVSMLREMQMSKPDVPAKSAATPEWPAYGTGVHDWRNYIHEELRAAWHKFTPEQQKLIADNAQIEADNEEWD